LDQLRIKEGITFESQVNEFRSGISTLLSIAGYGQDLPEFLNEELMANLDSVTASALELRSAIAQKISSCDMELIYFPYGTAFDGESMEDSFGDVTGNGQSNLSLCTTHLGMKVSRGVGGGEDGNTQVVVETLLKPKVALQSIAEDALGMIA
jgi:hypothetical protein